MPCLRQKSEMVSPLARSRSASRSNRATSSAFLRLLMGPSRTYFTRRLPFRLDQFSGGSPIAGVFGGRCGTVIGRYAGPDLDATSWFSAADHQVKGERVNLRVSWPKPRAP